MRIPTRSHSHSFRVIFCYIIFNPFPINVSLALGFWIGVKPLGDLSIADQARCHGYLQCEPILCLPNIKNVSIIVLASHADKLERFLTLCMLCMLPAVSGANDFKRTSYLGSPLLSRSPPWSYQNLRSTQRVTTFHDEYGSQSLQPVFTLTSFSVADTFGSHSGDIFHCSSLVPR